MELAAKTHVIRTARTLRTTLTSRRRGVLDHSRQARAVEHDGNVATEMPAPLKRMVMIGEGTHAIIMERNRMQLFREVQLFLDEAR
jgi:hypothetical protein